MTCRKLLLFLALASSSVLPASANLTPHKRSPNVNPPPTKRQAGAPGQPTKSGVPGTFEIVGNSGASAQQMFLGTPDRVYILDKAEGNPLQVNGYPAWGTEIDVSTNEVRGMFLYSNTFCAAGNVLANGSWVNFGGNQAVSYGGLTPTGFSQTGGPPYNDADGGKGVRILDPCDDQSCDWIDLPEMTTRRWYPTIENLEDGSLIVIGGDEWGGYVNDPSQNNPTYEFFPSQGAPIGLNILLNSMPCNLFPLTWLLPSGNLLIQSNWMAEVFDYKNAVEYPLPNIPNAVRVYPASGATAMLPLTPANNWTATVIFCGGTNLEPDQWPDQPGGASWNIAAYPADNSCVKISPDVSENWEYDDSIPEGRSMGQFIILPDGKLLLLNGANLGTAGYGNDSWAIGRSYADSPVMSPLIYDPNAPATQRFSRNGLQASTVPRMYHSSATLLPDGSVFVSGSNPNPDYDISVKYPTEYRTERFYPLYYSSRRPEPVGLPSTLSYGGPPFDVQLSAQDLASTSISNCTVAVMRTGFSTHAMNMGMRMVELATSYTGNTDGSGVLHVAQMPPNPAIFQPGPAMLFVVCGGVPSVGEWIMVGSGQIEQQPLSTAGVLPASSLPASAAANSTNGSTGTNGTGTGNTGSKSAAVQLTAGSVAWAALLGALVLLGASI
ncbi:copper radical oxidase [Dacryopinax primogenitus]|uniref:Copper radical oxidase n=1 Tax=Dacryopinax primogenitus (strain DJM 731) TaxID=1858805 RepID=M5GAX7_DACPD|nr:copper radical oxidase [Dacryopinax primogenitus]EJU01093.1 copper radical oxidase [Dacryopinax primogenitus]